MERPSPEERFNLAVDSWLNRPASTLDSRGKQIARVGVSAALAVPDLSPKQRADVVLQILPVLTAVDVALSNMPLTQRRAFTSISERDPQGSISGRI